MPSARPILMSAPMVRALLAGTKTQTRRIVKPQPNARCTEAFVGCDGIWRFSWPTARSPMSSAADDVRCPYGKPGDLLWVKETAHYGPNRVAYSADNAPLAKGETVDGWGPKRSSLLMPRWASRLTLEITEIRVERLQDITEADAKAEGAAFHDGRGIGHSGWRHDYRDVHATAASSYRRLWNEINGPGAWDANPWVWALTFKVHTANVDAVLASATEPV